MVGRRILSYFLCLSVALLVRVQLAQAQAPDRLDHFRIVPRFSVLHKSGGFAGIHERLRLLGEYDLHRGFDSGDFTAKFVDAEIWGSIISPFPAPAIAFDVDEILNLHELDGKLLPTQGPFDAYRFTGHTSDGSSVQLFGVMYGPWMYVAGGTQPPPGGADFFEYDVRWLARSRPWADVNDDGVVGAADYTTLRNSFGHNAAYDLTGDGRVNIADIQEWRSQYGESAPSTASFDAMVATAAAAFGGQVASVPEPSAWIVVVSWAAILAISRRTRRHVFK